MICPEADAFILAAGTGSRLLPLTATCPKPLLPLFGPPLIDYPLRSLAAAGCQQIFVNAWHLAPQLTAHLKALQDKLAIPLYCHVEAQLLGTGGGIAALAPRLARTLIIWNSDIIADVDLRALLAVHRAQRALATLLTRAAPSNEQAALAVDASGHVQRLLDFNKPNPGPTHSIAQDAAAPGRPCNYAGIMIIEPALLRFLPREGSACLIRQGVGPALAAGELIATTPLPGFFCDLGTPADYGRTWQRWLQAPLPLQHLPVPSVPRNAQGQVAYCSPSAHLAPGVVLRAPYFIAAGAHIAAGAQLLGGVVLGEQAHLGHDVQLTDTCVLPHASVAPRSVLRGTLVAPQGQLAWQP